MRSRNVAANVSVVAVTSFSVMARQLCKRLCIVFRPLPFSVGVGDRRLCDLIGGGATLRKRLSQRTHLFPILAQRPHIGKRSYLPVAGYHGRNVHSLDLR